MSNLPVPKSNVNILAIDGGAMMGAVPARILSYLDGSAAAITGGVNPVQGIYSVDGTGNDTNVFSPLCNNFDIIIGTSTGGILAAGLTVPPSGGSAPDSANQLLNFYYANGTTIFPLWPNGQYETQSTTELLYPFGKYSPATTGQPLFDNSGLYAAIAGTYGAPSGINCAQYTYAESRSGDWSRTLGAVPFSSTVACANLGGAKTGVAITSFNGNIGTVVGGNWAPNPNTAQNPWSTTIAGATPGGPLIVTGDTLGPDGNPLSVLQASLMTSAFPTLLPPVPFDLQFQKSEAAPKGQNAVDYFLDGGMFAGNPTMAAILLAQAMEYNVNCLVSVGCGAATQPSDTDLGYATVYDWGAGLNALNLGNGWLASQMSPFYSALMSFMGMGSGDYANHVLPLAMPGKFFRLQTPITYQTAAVNQTPANPAPYYGTVDALNGWVGDADAYVSEIGTTWTAMIAQIKQGGKAAQQS